MNPSNPTRNDLDDTVAAMGSQVSDTAEQAADKARNFGRSAADAIDQKRGAAASGLDSAASTLRSRRLPGGERVAGIAQGAADRLSSTATYVREHDVESMMSDVKVVVRRNPGPALVVAAVVGFLLGRALSRD